MLARPDVKRTYSRLKRPETDKPDQFYENSTEEKICDEEPRTHSDSSDSNKPEKMKKITDFFRVKRSSLRNEEEITDKPEKLSDITISGVLSSPITSVSNKLKQTYLDLGQKDLISTQCPECLMHYNKSFPSDVGLHKKFHANYLKGFTFSASAKNNYGEVIKEIAPADLMMKWSKYRFYEIKKFEGANLLRKMEFFLNFVHVQLGAETLSVEELKRCSAVLSTAGPSEKIIGFALFEPCRRVYKSVNGCDDSAIQLEQKNEIESFELLADNFGVSRIWVDEKYRSIGLASLLLDLKCKGKRERISFSQPTPAGFAFAKSYQKEHFNGQQCLIYLQ